MRRVGVKIPVAACTPLMMMGEKHVTSRRRPSLIHLGADSGFGASQLTLTFPLPASMTQNLSQDRAVSNAEYQRFIHMA
jgi:hypothetical protein